MLRILSRFFALCAASVLAARCGAQTAADPSTLHVFVNRVQIPVLVLNASHETAPALLPSDFRVVIQDIGAIKPSSVRLEGDDPIGMALVVDRSDRDEPLWGDLPKSLGPLLKALQPQDRISVYVMDGCGARRVGTELAPVRASALQQQAEEVAKTKSYAEVQRQRGRCEKPIGYWDMLTYAAARLTEFPGRRILVTLGASGTATTRLEKLQQLLVGGSVSLFPIVHGTAGANLALPYSGARQLQSGTQAQAMALVNPGTNMPSILELVKQAEGSGGMALATGVRDFAKTLARPVLLARGRYIIEFPRPDMLQAGTHHTIFVTDGRPRDFIRSAGISVPVASANERTDRAVADANSAPETTGKPEGTDPTAAPAEAPAAPPAHDTVSRATVTAPPAVVEHPAPAVAPVAATPIDPTDITKELRPSR